MLSRRREDSLIFWRDLALNIDIAKSLPVPSAMHGIVSEEVPSSYLTHLHHIVRLVMQLLDYPIESRGDLESSSEAEDRAADVEGRTSVAALSDWTSHILSNCSTRASGSTNHCMIWTSFIPRIFSSPP